jgi:acetyl-CoA carboxylase biotin carboxyl carrier protein
MADEHVSPASAPAPSPAPASAPAPSPAPSTDEILGLVDRLEALLRDAGVSELEVEAGGLGITLRKPSPSGHLPGAANPAATGPGVSPGVAAGATHPGAPGAPGAGPGSVPAPEPGRALRAVLAPLTGTWYLTPSPGAAPYVKPGDEVTSGQIIGLIEAMKLFNEIKSDASGRIVRVLVEHGALVKAKQALVEIEPAT